MQVEIEVIVSQPAKNHVPVCAPVPLLDIMGFSASSFVFQTIKIHERGIIPLLVKTTFFKTLL